VASDYRQVLTEAYRRMNARESSLEGVFHPEVEWYWPEATPGADVYRGHAQMLLGFDVWAESWEELVMEPVEIIEQDDYALVIATYRMRGVGSGLYLEHDTGHLHQFEDGLVRRWWMFGNADKARRRFLAGDRPAAGRP
jgi:ketosteroid isomerase-like protein